MWSSCSVFDIYMSGSNILLNLQNKKLIIVLKKFVELEPRRIYVELEPRKIYVDQEPRRIYVELEPRRIHVELEHRRIYICRTGT